MEFDIDQLIEFVDAQKESYQYCHRVMNPPNDEFFKGAEDAFNSVLQYLIEFKMENE